MSRCFPFPPPGYENKAKTDNTDILAKEKHKEKNHKKEKRKREGKEKETEQSKEKDREKKDRKKKHKDNNDRDKNKVQNKTLDEKRDQMQPEYSNVTSKLHFAGIKDNNFVLELDRRIRDEDKATGSQMAQKTALRDERRYELPGMAVESNPTGLSGEEEKTKNKRDANDKVNWLRDKEKTTGRQIAPKISVREQRRCELSGTTVESNRAGLVGGVEKTKIKREGNEKFNGHKRKVEESGLQNSNAKWLGDGNKATGSQLDQKVTVKDQRLHELPGTAVESNQTGNFKLNNGQRTKVAETGPRNSIAQNYARTGNQRVEGMARPVERKNNVQNQIEEKANTKIKESGSRDDKHKHRDEDKKSFSKDKDGEKAKRKEEKAKRKEARAKRKEERAKRKEQKAKRKEEKEKKKEKENGKEWEVNVQKRELNNQQAKLEESSQDSVITFSNIPSQSSKEIRKDFVGEKISTKRKDFEINGFSLDGEIRPNKLRRPISSSNPVVENGRNNEPCQTAIKLQSNWSKADAMADDRGLRANNFLRAQQPAVCSARSPTSVPSDDISSQSAEPPHPDSMYLNELLSIPQIEEPSFLDDQDWFGSGNLQSKMSQMDQPTGSGSKVEVWAESLQIVTADITALPYVVPY